MLCKQRTVFFVEIFDLYDNLRRPTGETMVRGEPVPEGRWRLVVHICVFNSAGQLLIQQRQPFKDGWPNLWDVTVGGSVLAGETSQEGARRELQEEVGLEADFSDAAPDFSSNFTGGYDDIYILHMDPDLSSLRLQESEVQAVRWAGLEEILSMINDGTFIPYGKEFIQFLFYRSSHGGNILRKG